jgi:hypothetical protein
MTSEEGKKSHDPFADEVVKHRHIDKELMANEILAMLKEMPLLKANLREGTSAQRQLFQSFKPRKRGD